MLSMTACMAIRLVTVELAWYSPILAFRLITVMGYMRTSIEVPIPSEFRYRWIIQAAMAGSEMGKSAHTREEYDTYIAMSVPCSVINNSDTAFALPCPFKELEPAHSNQGRTIVFRRGQWGKVIHRPWPNKPQLQKPSTGPAVNVLMPRRPFNIIFHFNAQTPRQ